MNASAEAFSTLRYRIDRVRVGGLAIDSVVAAVIGGSIHNGRPLHGLWFNVPSGRQHREHRAARDSLLFHLRTRTACIRRHGSHPPLTDDPQNRRYFGSVTGFDRHRLRTARDAEHLGFIALVLFGSALTPRTFPLTFRRESDDSLIHPDEWTQLAGRVGFRRGRSLPMHLRIAVESAMAETGWGETKITDVMYRRVRSGTFVLCNYRREARHSSDRSDWIEIRHETLLIYTARRARFPTFHVAPNYRPNRIFRNIFGKPWYHSDHDPGFHEQINLYTAAPEVVRPLLSDPVRCHLVTFVVAR